MAGPRSILSFDLNQLMRDLYGPTSEGQAYGINRTDEHGAVGGKREAEKNPITFKGVLRHALDIKGLNPTTSL